mgnify:CR=1 FL=1
MNLHLNAWANVNVLIFGKTPIVPMKIEQSISRFFPQMEEFIYSYESYEDAFDLAKESKSINLIFFEDCDYEVEQKQIVKNLSYHYEKTGFPCLFVAFYNSTPNINNFKDLSKISGFLEYIELDLLIGEGVKSFVEELWSKYVDKVREIIIPHNIESNIRSCFNSAQLKELNKLERVSSVLSAELNLDWKSKLILNSYFFIQEAKKLEVNLLRDFSGFVKLVENEINLKSEDMNKAFDKENTLLNRIVFFTNYIIQKNDSINVEEIYEEIKSKSKRKTTALEKEFIRNYATIYDILHDQERKLRVV